MNGTARDELVAFLDWYLLELHVAQWGRTWNVTDARARQGLCEYLADGVVGAALDYWVVGQGSDG